MHRLKTGDEVIVTAGKNKGSRGQVSAILGERIVIDNVNMVTHFIKANPQQNQSGGLVKKPAPIHQSNIMIYNPATGKGDRIGFRTLSDGRKVRVFKSNDEVVDV